jgi:hypothetical protein
MPANPFSSRFVDEDFNRVWNPETLSGPRDSVELRRARELRPFVEEANTSSTFTRCSNRARR